MDPALVIPGRRHELDLGSIPLVPLAKARTNAMTNSKLAREGDESAGRECLVRAMPAFAAQQLWATQTRFASPDLDKLPSAT